MTRANQIYTAIVVSLLSVTIAFILSAGIASFNPSVNGYQHDANLTMPMLSEDRYTIDHTPFSLPGTSGQCGEDSGIACK